MYLIELLRETWPILLALAMFVAWMSAYWIPPRADATGLAERYIAVAKRYARLHPTEKGNWDQ